jgi:hypothetical protein
VLTTLANVRLVPGMGLLTNPTDAYLTQIIAAADRQIKRYCKQGLELQSYSQYYNGSGRQDLVLRQFPVSSGQTTVSSASNGAVLPQATVNVVSTAGFDTGAAFAEGLGVAPTICVQVGVNSFTAITYTGVTATSFTGCSGGAGTLTSTANQNTVGQPVVWLNCQGYAGQGPNAFPDASLLQQGTCWYVWIDSANDAGNPISNRGLLRRIGFSQTGFPQSAGGWVGAGGYQGGGGRLAGSRLPGWDCGDGNLKVSYSAGFDPVPDDLVNACTTLACWTWRCMPKGSPLSSEGLGASSYSVMQQGADIPEIGAMLQTLRPYREWPLGV